MYTFAGDGHFYSRDSRSDGASSTPQMPVISRCASVAAGRPASDTAPSMITITTGGFTFSARLERAAAPRTVAALRRLLPLTSRIIHVRWSGEAGWVPFGDLDLGLGPENATSYPHPGQILLYPGGVSETEILIAYGYVRFASKAGQLAGNHCATIETGHDQLRLLGKKILWEGAQDITITEP